MMTIPKLVLVACCLIAGLSMPNQAAAELLELVPAAPTAGDSVILRLRPNTGPGGRQAQFVTSPDYPQITRKGNAITVRALVCPYPETNPGPMTRDLPLGQLAAGAYAVEITMTYLCTSIGPPPVTTWSGVVLVRGQQIEIPFLSELGLGMLGFALAGAAISGLGRRSRL